MAISNLAAHLYDFLPGSGNSRTAFPLAAASVGVAEYWEPGSKLPAITGLLNRTYELRRSKFCDLILEVVRQGTTYRLGKGNPLSRNDVERLSTLLLPLEFKIPDLHDPQFLAGFSESAAQSTSETTLVPSKEKLASLGDSLLALAGQDARQKGFAFERFLSDLFEAYGLAPRASFRNTGEQIDGSFKLGGHVYLVEAKWTAGLTSIGDLLTFSGKIAGKAEWSRGLFVSYNGFSAEGLTAFATGRRTNIVCMAGLDLHDVLARQLHFGDVIDKLARVAAETNRAHTSVRDLF